MLEDIFNLEKGGKLPYLPFIEKIEDYKNLRIIRLKGNIDMSTIPEYQKMLHAPKEKHGSLKQNILLDFKDVTHIDSSTIAILLVALHEIKHKRHKLALVNVPKYLTEMLNISEIQDLFTIYNSWEKAYKNLKDS